MFGVGCSAFLLFGEERTQRRRQPVELLHQSLRVTGDRFGFMSTGRILEFLGRGIGGAGTKFADQSLEAVSGVLDHANIARGETFAQIGQEPRRIFIEAKADHLYRQCAIATEVFEEGGGMS
jgi:hypothetical protein